MKHENRKDKLIEQKRQSYRTVKTNLSNRKDKLIKQKRQT